MQGTIDDSDTLYLSLPPDQLRSYGVRLFMSSENVAATLS